MANYVDSSQQLVTEILVRDIGRSTAFYRSLGFELARDGGDFVELSWEGSFLYLAELSAFPDSPRSPAPSAPAFPPANVRVMVPDVDRLWALANEVGATVVIPVDDRYYGLRDFTIADPDGFGVRFATLLA